MVNAGGLVVKVQQLMINESQAGRFCACVEVDKKIIAVMSCSFFIFQMNNLVNKVQSNKIELRMQRRVV